MPAEQLLYLCDGGMDITTIQNYRDIFVDQHSSGVKTIGKSLNTATLQLNLHRKQTMLRIAKSIYDQALYKVVIDGSLAYDISNESSDIDGVILIRDNGLHAKKGEYLFDQTLKECGIESNVRVVSPEFQLPGNEMFANLTTLIGGCYHYGEFDPYVIYELVRYYPQEYIDVVHESLGRKYSRFTTLDLPRYIERAQLHYRGKERL